MDKVLQAQVPPIVLIVGTVVHGCVLLVRVLVGFRIRCRLIDSDQRTLTLALSTVDSGGVVEDSSGPTRRHLRLAVGTVTTKETAPRSAAAVHRQEAA